MKFNFIYFFEPLFVSMYQFGLENRISWNFDKQSQK